MKIWHVKSSRLHPQAIRAAEKTSVHVDVTHASQYLSQSHATEIHVMCGGLTSSTKLEFCSNSHNLVFSSPEPKAQVSYCRPFSSVVRRPSSVNFLHFHLLLENAWLDFNQTWQESSLGVGDSKLFKSYVGPPWGPRGRAPKGQNHANFKHLLLQIQKENGQVM